VLRKFETDEESDKAQRLPPGAADSWNIDNNMHDEGVELTTSKPQDVIVVTSPVCNNRILMISSYIILNAGLL